MIIRYKELQRGKFVHRSVLGITLFSSEGPTGIAYTLMRVL